MAKSGTAVQVGQQFVPINFVTMSTVVANVFNHFGSFNKVRVF